MIVWHRHHVIRVEHVVTHGLGFRVGHVLEHVGRGDIAKRPDAFCGGAAVVINLDAAIVVHVNCCSVEIYLVTVWSTAGGVVNGMVVYDFAADGGDRGA